MFHTTLFLVCASAPARTPCCSSHRCDTLPFIRLSGTCHGPGVGSPSVLDQRGKPLDVTLTRGASASSPNRVHPRTLCNEADPRLVYGTVEPDRQAQGGPHDIDGQVPSHRIMQLTMLVSLTVIARSRYLPVAVHTMARLQVLHDVDVAILDRPEHARPRSNGGGPHAPPEQTRAAGPPPP